MDSRPGSLLYAGLDVLCRVLTREHATCEATMMDFLLVGLVTLFFAGAAGYVRVCDRL